nr:Chain A, Takeout-like protein 1 [Epiphyas postvittana]3E8W_A Chain A, Takeout-like protein 1 [Epiphyas postvittana]4G0S_A Chain A, Takeout-like protein 1 [Epiphyas postvittana]4G0S_B Chain B, Takeout-like protein 1 [Epiphyas postvittana]
GVLPVEKCNLEDSACMTSAFQQALPTFVAGLPDHGVEVMDVLDLDDFAFDLSGLQFTLKEGKLKGLKGAVIDNVKWDLKKKNIEVDFHLDATVKGHYTAGGRILILPITGDGQMKLKLKNIHIHLVVSYEMEKDAEGVDHVIFKKYTVTFDVKDNAQFGLTNLFNGNKELSDTMLTFLNQNWKQVSEEFGKPVMEAAAKKIFKNIKHFLAKVPIAEIANV